VVNRGIQAVGVFGGLVAVLRRQPGRVGCFGLVATNQRMLMVRRTGLPSRLRALEEQYPLSSVKVEFHHRRGILGTMGSLGLRVDGSLAVYDLPDLSREPTDAFVHALSGECAAPGSGPRRATPAPAEHGRDVAVGPVSWWPVRSQEP
jgi:hypothetical protein